MDVDDLYVENTNSQKLGQSVFRLSKYNRSSKV